MPVSAARAATSCALSSRPQPAPHAGSDPILGSGPHAPRCSFFRSGSSRQQEMWWKTCGVCITGTKGASPRNCHSVGGKQAVLKAARPWRSARRKCCRACLRGSGDRSVPPSVLGARLARVSSCSGSRFRLHLPAGKKWETRSAQGASRSGTSRYHRRSSDDGYTR